jgi:hypothetical protein
MTVYRPDSGTWYVLKSDANLNFNASLVRHWGWDGSVPLQNCDFDGDGEADIAVWQPSNGYWYILTSSSSFNTAACWQIRWGMQGDIPLMGCDFDGDGKTDIAVWRPSNGTWYALLSSKGYDPKQRLQRPWGLTGDVPIKACDFDGDGKTDMAVWRPSNGTWYVLLSSKGFDPKQRLQRQWGVSGDLPVQGDFDGDGKEDMAVWRPSIGTWCVLTSGTGYSANQAVQRQLGAAGDIPIQNSDFDGDGKTDMAVWHPCTGVWDVRSSSTNFTNLFWRQWGTAGDIPLHDADFDGDGKTDMAVWRPSTGTWFVLTSITAYIDFFHRQWGQATDLPIPGSTNIDGLTNQAYAYGQGGFLYSIADVPDFDQRRDAAPGVIGLPGKGSYYCVPTAALDFTAYLADHGYPLLGPGTGDFQLVSYNGITNSLLAMGSFMGTDPATGTTGSGAVSGLQNWLDGSYPGSFTGSCLSWSLFSDLANWAVQGGLVMVGMGQYDAAGNRQSGHLVALVYAKIAGSEMLMGIHDPADDGNLYSQSTFTTEYYNIQDEQGFFQGSSRVLSHVVGYGKNNNYYIDGAVLIWPRLFNPNPPSQYPCSENVPNGGLTPPPQPQVRSARERNLLDLAFEPGCQGVAFVPQSTRHGQGLQGDDCVAGSRAFDGLVAATCLSVPPTALRCLRETPLRSRTTLRVSLFEAIDQAFSAAASDPEMVDCNGGGILN